MRSTLQHLEHLEKLLRRFEAVGMRCHPSKTILAGSSMPYLGHVVSADGMRPEDAKVSAIMALPVPTSCEQVRSVLGVIGFYRCYVPHFSAIAKPLNALLKKHCRFEWGEEQRVAYTALKAALTTPGLVLRHPDPTKPFHLYTDWSTNGIAAVLNQREARPWQRFGASRPSAHTCTASHSPSACILITARSCGCSQPRNLQASKRAGSCLCRTTPSTLCTGPARTTLLTCPAGTRAPQHWTSQGRG